MTRDLDRRLRRRRHRPEDVVRFDHGGRTYAIYRTADDRYFATDGLCTHEKVHLADGFVDGHDHRMPEAQRPLRLHHRRGEGRAGLRRSQDLSGEGRGRAGVHQARLTAAQRRRGGRARSLRSAGRRQAADQDAAPEEPTCSRSSPRPLSRATLSARRSLTARTRPSPGCPRR